jgi:hypothetical protein
LRHDPSLAPRRLGVADSGLSALADSIAAAYLTWRHDTGVALS